MNNIIIVDVIMFMTLPCPYVSVIVTLIEADIRFIGQRKDERLTGRLLNPMYLCTQNADFRYLRVTDKSALTVYQSEFLKSSTPKPELICVENIDNMSSEYSLYT